MGHEQDEEKDESASICLKYLLFLFNFLFWIGGTVVIAMGVWTLLEKSNYIVFLANSTLSVSAYILLFAGSLVMVTGFLGCCAVIRENKTCLLLYLIILISVYAAELAAGALAYIYYEMISEELKEYLNDTMVYNYAQPGMTDVTYAIDHLQQDFRCCGSESYEDWRYSLYVTMANNSGIIVPDSCCKTMTLKCGRRDHPSNIYNVEGGCITILEEFIQEHLLLVGAASIGIACFQLIGVAMSACFLCILFKEEREELYKTI